MGVMCCYRKECKNIMETTKGHHKGNKIDLDDFFNQYTR